MAPNSPDRRKWNSIDLRSWSGKPERQLPPSIGHATGSTLICDWFRESAVWIGPRH